MAAIVYIKTTFSLISLYQNRLYINIYTNIITITTFNIQCTMYRAQTMSNPGSIWMKIYCTNIESEQNGDIVFVTTKLKENRMNKNNNTSSSKNKLQINRTTKIQKDICKIFQENGSEKEKYCIYSNIHILINSRLNFIAKSIFFFWFGRGEKDGAKIEYHLNTNPN